MTNLYEIRMKRSLGILVAIAVFTSLLSSGVKAEDTNMSADRSCERPPYKETNCVLDLTRQFLSADEDQRTKMLESLPKLLIYSFQPFKEHRDIKYSRDFLSSAFSGLRSDNFLDRSSGLLAIFRSAHDDGKRFLIDQMISRVKMSSDAEARELYLSLLNAHADESSSQIYEAILTSGDEILLGDFARILRGKPLPPEVKDKLQQVLSSSEEIDIRIKIAQTVGPGSTAFDQVFDLVRTRLALATSDDERTGWSVKLGNFPGRNGIIIEDMEQAIANIADPSKAGIIARSIAETGSEGLLRLAYLVDVEPNEIKQRGMAIVLAAIGCENILEPREKALPILNAALKVRLKSDDPLVQSSVYALLISYGKMSIDPIEQILGSTNGQAREDLLEALDRVKKL